MLDLKSVYIIVDDFVIELLVYVEALEFILGHGNAELREKNCLLVSRIVSGMPFFCHWGLWVM